ncbi:NAD-dependent epimerase/dehydratase family protein, partial [Candidatus Micrarchaeota archaeon]|nr:NAD-dependent epimerase/dehydratase family protein [Candidatus Micrarchaeota archaeon]
MIFYRSFWIFLLMKILITGGSGFIGSNLANELLFRGHEVRLVDTLNKPAIKLDGVIVQKGDITDKEFLEKAVSGCEIVFHEAALISVPDSFKKPEKFMEVNVQGTRNVLEACRKHDVEKVILASSAAVYGDEPSIPKTEESPVLPQSPYAES